MCVSEDLGGGRGEGKERDAVAVAGSLALYQVLEDPRCTVEVKHARVRIFRVVTK